MAYQAKTWKYGKGSYKLAGSDLNTILAKIPSTKVVKKLAATLNRRHTVSARELIHIMDSQSVSRAISRFRRLIPKAFPSKPMLYVSLSE